MILPTSPNPQQKYAYWEDFDKLIVCSLGDDAVWRNDTIIVPITPGEKTQIPPGLNNTDGST